MKRINAEWIISNGGGERDALLNLSEKEYTMDDPFTITLLSKPSARREQNIIFFTIIGNKTGLVIHTKIKQDQLILLI